MLTEEQQEVVESAAEVSFALRTLRRLRCALQFDRPIRFDRRGAARCRCQVLYGLIHARYIVTSRGLSAMVRRRSGPPVFFHGAAAAAVWHGMWATLGRKLPACLPVANKRWPSGRQVQERRVWPLPAGLLQGPTGTPCLPPASSFGVPGVPLTRCQRSCEKRAVRPLGAPHWPSTPRC